MMFPDEFFLPTKRSIRFAVASALAAAGFDVTRLGGSNTFDLPPAQRVCFVLVDGLGVHNLDARIGHVRALRSFSASEPLTSTVPSTTATAITALGTTAEAGRTAMLGYSLRSPASRRPFSLIQWDESGLDPRQWQRVPTLFEELGDQAQFCRAIQPPKHIDSGLSLCALRGLPALPALTPDDRAMAVGQAFAQGARFVYLYWGDIDKCGHHYGWQSQEWIEALEELDTAIADMKRTLPRGTLIVITADHGMIDVGERLDIDDYPELRLDVEITAGEERAVQVYTKQPDTVRERWANVLGERALVMTKDEVVNAGLLGDMTEHAYERAGDVFAFIRGQWALIDQQSRINPHLPLQRGVHGSLTAHEMHVPLLTGIV